MENIFPEKKKELFGLIITHKTKMRNKKYLTEFLIRN